MAMPATMKAKANGNIMDNTDGNNKSNNEGKVAGNNNGM
jgi:hypothetical protein